MVACRHSLCDLRIELHLLRASLILLCGINQRRRSCSEGVDCRRCRAVTRMGERRSMVLLWASYILQTTRGLGLFTPHTAPRSVVAPTGSLSALLQPGDHFFFVEFVSMARDWRWGCSRRHCDVDILTVLSAASTFLRSCPRLRKEAW
jgi:hypothetical protein